MKGIKYFITESVKTYIYVCEKYTEQVYKKESIKKDSIFKFIKLATELYKESNYEKYFVVSIMSANNPGKKTDAENIIFDIEIMEQHNDAYCKIINSDGQVIAIGNYNACDDYVDEDDDNNFTSNKYIITMPNLMVIYISKEEFNFYKSQNIQILK